MALTRVVDEPEASDRASKRTKVERSIHERDTSKAVEDGEDEDMEPRSNEQPGASDLYLDTVWLPYS